MHDAADARERAVARELQPRQHLFVGDALAAGRKMRALEAEAERAGGQRLAFLEPGEPRLGVDEAAHQPGAGEAIGPERPARGPGALLQALARAERGGRLGREHEAAHLVLGGDERRLRAAGRARGKEVERGDRLVLAPLLVEHARDPARVGLAEADAQALHRLDQVLVARRAVEELPEGLLLRAAGGLHVQCVAGAGAAPHVFGQGVDGLAVGRRVGQEVGAFAQYRRAERLERAQHAHARGWILGGQHRHQHQPVFHAA
jgi:hypothetical protein